MSNEINNIAVCSIRIAATILNKSERTLQRWCDDGVLVVVYQDQHQKIFVAIRQVIELFGTCADTNFSELILQADSGDAEALNELGVVMLQEKREGSAVKFFQEAARQDYADAMHFLYQCYERGLGVEKDDNQAMFWLSKAASLGHVIAKIQTNALRERAIAGISLLGI